MQNAYKIDAEILMANVFGLFFECYMSGIGYGLDGPCLPRMQDFDCLNYRTRSFPNKLDVKIKMIVLLLFFFSLENAPSRRLIYIE